MEKLIIVPDVHGRSFYKDLLNIKDTKIVFLGDYLDPYPDEGISVEEAIANFEEILDFAKSNKNVKLLLGNHDCGYIWSDVCESRRSYKYYHDIKKMFKDNMDLFDLVYKTDNCLLSHAGIHKLWFDFSCDMLGVDVDYDKIDVILNNALHINHGYLSDILSVYSKYRGWDGSFLGSCVWADVREWFDTGLTPDNIAEDRKLNIFQIFGHTQLKEPIITKDFACIDVREYFTLEDNKLTYNKGDYTLWEK